jgi:glycosyl hydrolase family 99
MTGHARERAISAIRRVMVVGAIAALCSALPAPHAKATSASPLSPGKPTGRHAGASSIPLFAYYYLWFNHTSWNRAKKDYPLVGTYSSSDPRIVRIQMREAKSAGINGFIVSWKNTTIDDQRMRLLMTIADQEHFKLAMIYEGLNFDRHPLPLAEVSNGFKTFADHYASDPAFFRLGGKPLTIWSGTWAYSHAAIASVTAPVRRTIRVLATEKNLDGFLRVADVTDGDAYYWSSVNPATNTYYGPKLDSMSHAIHRRGKYWIAPFAPGFDARMVGGHEVVPRDNGATMRIEYATALRSSPDVLGLISWNEFSENSYVEPSVRYKNQSLDVLRQLRGTSVPTPTGPAEASDLGATSSASGPGPWPNVLRLALFPLLLLLAVGILRYTRRQTARRDPAKRRHASQRTSDY